MERVVQYSGEVRSAELSFSEARVGTWTEGFQAQSSSRIPLSCLGGFPGSVQFKMKIYRDFVSEKGGSSIGGSRERG